LRLLLLLATLLGAIALSVATTASATPVCTSASCSTASNGYVYNAKGRLVGHIEGDQDEYGDPVWDVSDGCNSFVDFVEGRMRIYEGFHWYHFAKRRAADRWTVHDDANGYEGTLRRVSATRWNIYRGGRKVKPGVWAGGRYVGYAKGRGLDGVAAGFAYISWYGLDCFDL
jgi:hypothetical protein